MDGRRELPFAINNTVEAPEDRGNAGLEGEHVEDEGTPSRRSKVPSSDDTPSALRDKGKGRAVEDACGPASEVPKAAAETSPDRNGEEDDKEMEPTSAQPADPSAGESSQKPPAIPKDGDKGQNGPDGKAPMKKRTHRDFPLIDPIGHIKACGGKEYDYQARKPQGYRTLEKIFKWGLHKHDWFYIKSFGQCLITLASRSMVYEIGIHPSEMPVVTNKDDLAEAEGLPDHPICMESLHYNSQHGPEECYWPAMTKSMGGFDAMPKLDREHTFDVDFLNVDDPDNVTHLYDTASPNQNVSRERESRCVIYRRMDPKLIGIPWVPLPPKESDMPLTAAIKLSSKHPIGSGHSASVWSAVYDLPYFVAHEMFDTCYRPDDPRRTHAPYRVPEPPPGFYGKPTTALFPPEDMKATDPTPEHWLLPTRFLVAAKVANVGHTARKFSHNEAKIYDAIPQYLCQDFSGYQLVPPIRLPQPACAIVPKTYGYYIPDVTYNKLSNGMSVIGKDRQLCPILLMEQCGTPMNLSRMNSEHKRICYTMLERLHSAGFVQQSMAIRNFLVQPGPLRVAPKRRSMRHPSFRIIDFGRGMQKSDSNYKEYTKWCKADRIDLEYVFGLDALDMAAFGGT